MAKRLNIEELHKAIINQLPDGSVVVDANIDVEHHLSQRYAKGEYMSQEQNGHVTLNVRVLYFDPSIVEENKKHG